MFNRTSIQDLVTYVAVNACRMFRNIGIAI